MTQHADVVTIASWLHIVLNFLLRVYCYVYSVYDPYNATSKAITVKGGGNSTGQTTWCVSLCMLIMLHLSMCCMLYRVMVVSSVACYRSSIIWVL